MMPPAKTTTAAKNTPARKRLPITFSTLRSVHRLVVCISDSSRNSLVNHLQSEKNDHEAEYQPQRPGFGFDQNPGTEHRPSQYAQHDRHRHTRIDVTTVQVHTSAGGSRDANHEVAGRGGNLEGNSHGLIHGHHFHGS